MFVSHYCAEVSPAPPDDDADGLVQRTMSALNERMRRSGTREGFADWQSPRFADASGRWLLEIVEYDDGSTAISWGTSEGGLGVTVPNPTGLVIKTADW